MKRFLSLCAMVIGLALATGCSQIDTGNVGVQSTLGQVKDEVLPPGFHMTAFQKTLEVSGKELLLPMYDLKPQTSDKITLADLDVDVYVQIDPSKAPKILTRWPNDVQRLDGEDGARVGIGYVTRQAREAIYNAVTKYGSATVHTERVNMAAAIVAGLQKDLDDSVGKGWFFVRSVNVRNLVTDPALEANIKAAAAAQFEDQKKQREIEIAKKEAERKRIEATGEADAIRIKSQAINSQGGAEYVQLQAIAKWDGKLPVTQAGGAVPFISVK